MAIFPGNPFATKKTKTTPDLDATVNAIELLAFELRTLNMQRQAAAVADTPDWSDAPTGAFELWFAMQQEIGHRLGIEPPA